MFRSLIHIMKKRGMLPRISETERQALEAGDVWLDGDLFAGKLDFNALQQEPYEALSAEEQAFVDGPCEELAQMVDAWTLYQTREVPEEVMNFLKKEGFFGLRSPKEYGGKNFSAQGISTVLGKVFSISGIVGNFVNIANSIGPAELIAEYGTQEQKDTYLPMLTRGEHIPCFALTEPTAGSDAASIKAEGVVFKDDDGEIKIRFNFEKRYITLAPAATLLSLAAQVQDPDNLLGKGEFPGITVTLIEKGTPGLNIGRHHQPVGEAFYNGPIWGKDVVVPASQIMGGVENVGQGWRMLMEQLAGGRAISLPAVGTAQIRTAAMASGAYAAIRQQFGMPISVMEGIQEPLGELAALTYTFEASRVFTCSALDHGHEPPVLSALLKYTATELAQRASILCMDIMGGKAVMEGPSNMMAKSYASSPVAITVEGANILTRTLITFGQGANRCHPYAQHVLAAALEEDVPAFRKQLLGWVGMSMKTLLRSWFVGLTRGRLVSTDGCPHTKKYQRKLGWSAARFAFLTNLALFTIGGKLKARGQLSGRYADALSWTYLAMCALRRWQAEGRKQEDLPVLDAAMEYAFARVQTAYEGIYSNFEVPVVGGLLKTVGNFFLKLNPIGGQPSDKTIRKAAQTLLVPDERYARLAGPQLAYGPDQPGFGQLDNAFRLQHQARPVVKKIRKAQKSKQLPKGDPVSLAQQAWEAKVIDKADYELLQSAISAVTQAIQVDSFSREEFIRGVATSESSASKEVA